MKTNKPSEIHQADSDDPALCAPDHVLLDCRIATRLEEIEKLSEAVHQVLPDPDLAFSVNLCLEELITNTILHGLKGASDRFIQVQIGLSNDWLEIRLKDDAPCFDPFMQAPPPNLDPNINHRPIGGLGVHLVKMLMDETRAHCDGSGNLLILRKHLHDRMTE